MIRCRYRKDVGQIPFVGKKIFIVALDHQHLCHDGCGDHNQNVRKQIEDDQQIRQLRKLGKEESEASVSDIFLTFEYLPEIRINRFTLLHPDILNRGVQF